MQLDTHGSHRAGGPQETIPVEIGEQRLQAVLGIAPASRGLVIFAHGSGSGRLSPRNNYVAERLRSAELATLLLDLLTPIEERDRRNVFDVGLLAERLALANDWAGDDARTRDLPVGYFGASTGAAAALIAAADRPGDVAAVVSRGGRPDLAGDRLPQVVAPTLLIVGGADTEVLELNRRAAADMHAEVAIEVVPDATHLFEEPGALDAVAGMAARWLSRHLVAVGRSPGSEGG